MMFKEKARTYQSMSAMVRTAVAKHDDRSASTRLEVINAMAALFKKFQSDLSKVGGNLNQVTKRANELAIDSQLTPEFLDKIFLPHVLEVRKLLLQVKKEQERITKKAIGLQ